jgi:hypothetical protein
MLMISCRKESFITSPDASIRISEEVLKFDTVFASIGSITKVIRIVNENDQKILISSIKLMGGNNSAFKLNIDGTPGPEMNNIEIRAEDSLYVFVQVTIDPTIADLPFIVRDSIQVTYNGNVKKIQLEAWGQNAHFFRNKTITSNETWNNDLPYVILGSLTVQENTTLTINKGCRIFLHADAPVIIDGTLMVNGEADTSDRVYFRGDRLDKPYANYPASWPGIYFSSTSINNILNYAVIQNGYQSIGVQDPATNSNPKLILNECIIDNAYDAGIIASNSSIRARNCLITNCGRNIYLVQGGDYQFDHLTAATISNNFISHSQPVLTVANFSNNNSPSPLNAIFNNSIFWGENGNVENEVDIIRMGNTTTFQVTFNKVLWKMNGNPTNATIVNGPALTANPVFDSINVSENYFDFRITKFAQSPAIDAGLPVPGVNHDLDGKPRPVGPAPDLGSFEKQ